MQIEKKEASLSSSALGGTQSDCGLTPSESMDADPVVRVSTGVTGLDEILRGGLIARRSYMLLGKPGSGKTTLGLHFLVAGAARDESTLFITLGESTELIHKNAQTIGFDLKNIAFLDLSANHEFFVEVEKYNVLSPDDAEPGLLTREIIEQIERLKPQRVFLDAVIQFRHLSSDTIQFRRQVLAFLQFLTEQGATVLFTSESSELAPDDFLRFICDGVLHLNASCEGRSISISKFRGSDFDIGQHSMRLTASGMKVFPRLMPNLHKREFVIETVASGIPYLDELLHGGLERGTITLVTGPSGVGKTTLGLQFMKEAAGRGERSVVYTFEEWAETIIGRCESINMPVRTMIERGTLEISQVEPLQFTPDEFAHIVRQEIEQKQTSIVMLDSIAGYQLSVRKEELALHLHALTKYLQNMGVTVLLINEVEAITGEFKVTEAGISHIADNIIFLRYLEMQGELHRAIGVLKKRLTSFEKTMRELDISRYGIKVNKQLTNVRGILSGTPQWIESTKDE